MDFLQVMLDSEISEVDTKNLTANADNEDTPATTVEDLGAKGSEPSKSTWQMKKGKYSDINLHCRGPGIFCVTCVRF